MLTWYLSQHTLWYLFSYMTSISLMNYALKKD